MRVCARLFPSQVQPVSLAHNPCKTVKNSFYTFLYILNKSISKIRYNVLISEL